MSVNRRTFMKVGVTGAALAVAGPSMLVLDGCTGNWISVVEADIPVVVEIVSTIVSVVGQATGNGALSAVVAAALNQGVKTLQAGLQAFQDAVNAYKAAKTQGNIGSVIAALTAIQGDVQNVIATLPIQIPGVSTIIVAAIGTVITVLAAIQSLIPGAAPATAQLGVINAALKGKVVAPNAAALRVGFNAVLVYHGYGGQQIQ